MSDRIESIQNSHVWLVAEHKQQIIAYAYGSAHRSRKAYQGTSETSVYVMDDYQGRGVATNLYQATLDLLTLQGYTKALGIITLPNEASCQLHLKLGFKELVKFNHVGFKFGKWHSTQWYEKDLREDSLNESLAIRDLGSLIHHPKLSNLLNSKFELK